MIKFVGFRLAGHRRDPWKNDVPIIKSLLVAHTLNGMGLASAHKQEELAADSFAVQVLNDPEPVATMFTALDEFKDDPFSGSPTRAEPITASEIASGIGISFLAYGYVGPLMTHPGDEDRAANARATPLTGMPAPRPVENPRP
jgi:Zn-dependent protease with chaperone function